MQAAPASAPAERMSMPAGGKAHSEQYVDAELSQAIKCDAHYNLFDRAAVTSAAPARQR